MHSTPKFSSRFFGACLRSSELTFSYKLLMSAMQEDCLEQRFTAEAQ